MANAPKNDSKDICASGARAEITGSKKIDFPTHSYFEIYSMSQSSMIQATLPSTIFSLNTKQII